MRSPTRIEAPNAETEAAASEEPAQPAQASEDSDETQASPRAPSDTTEVNATAELAAKGRVVDPRPQPPRRNYTWLDRSSPPPPIRPGKRAQYADEGQRPVPDPVAHLPPGTRRPGIVRVREVRRDYEYHYEYIYEDVPPSQAPQLPPAAPPPPQLAAPTPPVAQPAKPLAAQLPADPRPSERPVAAPAGAAVSVVIATAARTFAAPEIERRPSLASHAGFAAVIAMGMLLLGLATAFYVSTRSASHAASPAAKPATAEAPTAAAAPPTLEGAPAATLTSVAGAAPDPEATATSASATSASATSASATSASATSASATSASATSASAAKRNNRKKPSTAAPPH